MSFSQQNFLDAVYAKLVTLGLPVYNAVATPNAATPYIVYSIIGDVPAIYFGTNNDDFRILLQVDLYDRREGSKGLSGGLRELRAKGELVKSALHKQYLTVANGGNVNGWCTRRSDVRVENDNFNRIMFEFLFLGSEV